MRTETRETLMLALKTIALIIGSLMSVAALVDLVVAGFSLPTLLFLAVGLALAVPPLAFAFRDAVGEAKRGRI